MMQTMSVLINIVLAITIIQNADCNGPYLQNCETDLQCPDGYACLRPGYGKGSAKAQMKCYPCCCREKTQCYIKSKLSGINCDCGDSGYTGACCETDINDCYNNSCLNDGTCIDGVNNYTCICPEGFSGRNCETALIPPTCMANNNCFKTASECEQPGTGCYVEEQDQDEVISNTWSGAFMILFFHYNTVEECQDICLYYAFGTCVAYSFNPTAKTCGLYSITPAEGLVTQDSNTTDLYVLRCSSC